MDKSYFYAWENNARHREARSSAVLFDAFVSVLALLMTLAMLMSPGSFVADYAYAVNETSSSVRVATFDQLSDALGNDEVSDIIIDSQAAKELADDKSTDGITFGGSDVFYIPVESPLVVSHDVTISSEEPVIFARSGKGGDGRYDSSAFRGQSKETPALFNVEQGKTLTLDADITITGEEVSSSFDEDRASFEFTVKSGDGICFIYTKGGSVIMNEGVLLTGLDTDGNTKAPVYIDGTDGAASLVIDGAEIVDNSLGQTEGGKSTVGGIMLRGANASAELRKGEISGNSADVAGVIVKEGAGLNVGGSFGIDEKDIYEEKAEKETSDEETVKKDEAAEKEESGKKDASGDAAEETTAAPKRTLKSAGSPALRNGGNTTSQIIEVVDGTTTVSTTRQLKAALARKDVTTIIIDETGAFSEVGITDESGNKNVTIEQTASNPDKKFYLSVDEPLTMVTNDAGNRTITIKSKTIKAGGKEVEKEVVLARSDLFGTKATGETPAIFNVPEGVTLNLSSRITMSGDTVTSAYRYKDNAGNDLNESGYSPGQEAIDSGIFVLGTDEYFGIVEKSVGTYQKQDYLGRVSADKAKELSLNAGGFIVLTHKDRACHVNNNGRIIEGAPNESLGDWRLKALDSDGNPKDGYVTQLTTGTKYVITSGVDYYGKDLYVKFDGTNFTRDVNFGGSLQFKAAKSVEDVTEDQEYEGIKFKFDVESAVRIKSEVKPGGYFIHAADGGKVTINEGVTLSGLNTAADVEKAAPIYIGGGSTFKMTGGVISNNTVGYGANEADSNGKTIQYIQNKLEKTDMTNTAGGVILKGSDTVGEFTRGEISGNKADAGAVIVTDGALVTMEDDFVINDNIGYHHAGAVQVERGGRFIMNGGLMNGNVAWYKGGAVWATQWGTNGYADINWSVWPKEFPILNNEGDKGPDGVFVMNGGTLSNNTAFARGGAVEVESNGVVLNNGVIENNKCRSLGGAIYVEGDAQSYSYTLKINNGYIGNNRSVTHEKGSSPNADQNKADNYTLNRYLKDGELTGGGNDSWDQSFSGAMGNGGGVWLCPVGGSSVFASDKVLIDNNAAKRTGTDFYLHKGNGAMIVQNIAGNWVDERTNPAAEVNFDQENGSVLNGPVALRNDKSPNYTENQSAVTDPETGKTKNVVIKNNISRDGGGIAANGTLVFGSTNDVDRYDARINITKEWLGITPTKVKFEIGYLDSNNIFVPLKDGTVAEQPANYEFELDGNADTPAGSDSESPAFGGSAVGEVEKESDTKWKASAFIPASVTLTDGTIYPLYEFVNPDGGTLSPANQSDLAKIRQIIRNTNQNLEIAQGSWKLKIREIDANFNVTVRDIEVDNSKTQVLVSEVPLYDPVTGKDTKTGFSVYFSTVELNQTIINKGRGIEFTKVASDTGRALTGTEFYITDAIWGNGFRAWYVPGTRDSDTGAALQNCTIADCALNKEPLTPNAQGKVEITNSMLKEGKSLSNGTQGDPKEYLLFETKSADGYARKTTPWLVEIDYLGNVKITEVGTSHQGKAITVPNGKSCDSLTAVEGKATESVYANWWPGSWYTETAATDTKLTLRNDWEPIRLKKIGSDISGSNNGLGGAEFVLYKAVAGKHLYTNTDWKRTGITSADNGELSLPVTEQGLYFLYEIMAPNGYVRERAPWLIYVDSNKTVKVIKKQELVNNNGQTIDYYYNGNAHGTWESGATAEASETALESWLNTSKYWEKSWYNLDISTWTKDNTYPNQVVFLTNGNGTDLSANKELPNSKAYILPSAGGMGTYWFMVIGAMMMGFAATAVFTGMNIRKVFRR